MKIKKKTIIISVAAVAVIGAGIGVLGKNFRNSQVNVYPVTDLSQSIWQSGTSLDGTIASQVSQEVRLQENQIVSAVHVQEGQEVKKGDPLLTYDMTLINIDLETEKLSRQQLEIKKKGLEQELEKLKKDRAEALSWKGVFQVEFLGGSKGSYTAENLSGCEKPLDPLPDQEEPTDPEQPQDPEEPLDPEQPQDPEEPLDPEQP